jgi:hypothetical protein
MLVDTILRYILSDGIQDSLIGRADQLLILKRHFSLCLWTDLDLHLVTESETKMCIYSLLQNVHSHNGVNCKVNYFTKRNNCLENVRAISVINTEIDYYSNIGLHSCCGHETGFKGIFFT